MAEEVLLSFEESLTRPEIAAHLRSLAEAFDGEGETAIAAGDQRVSLSPPDRSAFELEVEREAGENNGDSGVEFEVEAEIEWTETDGPAADNAGQSTPEDATTPNGVFECYTDRRDQWRWRLVYGETIAATGARGFDSLESAQQRIDRVRTAGPLAETVTLD